MLTKRTNILFDEKIFKYLILMARQNNTSIGELVRKAVIKVYIQENNDKKTEAFDKIINIRKTIKAINSAEIKELIDYGRRS